MKLNSNESAKASVKGLKISW